MHDLRWIRENPDAFDQGLARRGVEPCAAHILELDAKHRAVVTEAQTLLAKRNEASKQIGALKKAGEDASAAMAAVSALKDRIAALEAEAEALAARIADDLSPLANLPAASTPDGPDESANVVVRQVGAPIQHAFAAKEHDVLGPALGMDFDSAATMSGARFVALRGPLARLHRALGQFMLDLHVTAHGYEEVNPPLLVRDEAVFGTGQLPKFAEDLFRTTDDRWLVPTAEVPLANMVAGKLLEEKDLPLRFAAFTPCFRSEAGAAGRDTRGMIRQHQFEKVELVSITKPEDSNAELARMLACAEEVLKCLGLAYQVMELCTGDLGFSAAKTYDLEVWLPGQARYREISSCSTTGAFQARRMNARFRRSGAKGGEPVHTLNGSGVAVGRALVAVLETYQNPDGSVTVPEALHPYMGGVTVIGP